MSDLELHDVQGLIARGYAHLKAASYILLRIGDAVSARAWLGAIAPRITPAPDPAADSALNVAFTASGLTQLGLGAEIMHQFSDEFTAGMTTPHRQRMFGDLGPSAPETWLWGGPSTPTPHVLLALIARDTDILNQRYSALAGEFAGVSVITRLDSDVDLDGKEHFGFADGISQPTVEGLSDRQDTPPNTIRTGEFILGYVNEYSLYTDRPLLDRRLDPEWLLPADVQGSGKVDLGRNGTFLVFRQLAQDVRGFWRFVDSATRAADGSSDVDRRNWLAAHMVGRWPSGAPVTLSPDADNPRLATANDFTYQYADQFGFNCPIGAHVRRAHPRDSLDPAPGTARSVELDKRHRLLRRGREYGPPVPPDSLYADPPPDDPERGLYFICLGANIGRQFEFVQHSWVNNPKFDELYDEADPVVGYHPVGMNNFSIPREPVRVRYTNLPQFVTTRGGAYFFLPGLRALRYLASLR
ncbi:MAG: Dyp-type peroxidase [Chloroflexi bacterium]|nr:Dyp-type peroxidase [Chloroflexota bacterium]